MNNKRVGFIGLGRIGFPIALNISKAGFDLTAFDAHARPDYASQLLELGSEIAPSLKELAGECDVIITVLPNSSAVEDVLLSEEFLTSVKPGTICLDVTSGFPEDTIRIARKLSSYGVKLLDAPICNGGVPGAYERELRLCVGGDRTSFEFVTPILSAAAKEVQHVGELGMGHALKAISNYLIFASTSVISEAMAIGAASGFDPSKVITELKSCAASKILNLDIGYGILNESSREVEFRADLATKDLRYASQLAKQHGVISIMCDAAHEVYQFSVQSGHANEEAIRAPWAMMQKLEKSTV